jgi:hypothetical protein
MRRRVRDAHDAAMTNTGRTTETATVAGGQRASKPRPPRRWAKSAIAVGLAGGLAVGTAAFGFGSSPGAPRVAISDGTSNT